MQEGSCLDPVQGKQSGIAEDEASIVRRMFAMYAEDFYLEEVVLFQIQQHILELGESDRLLQEEKERAIEAVEHLKKECRTAENEIEKAKKKRMAEFEAYALGKSDSYNSSMDQMEALRKKHEGLMEQLSQAEDKVREYKRVKIHDSFAVMKLTPELMDE